ncbi:fucose isomerase [Pedococcus sp. 2YAF34]|uniref:fucose isomerase n=1 Tax=Pedococcus sp. 2YAF34 TaxID=3233032 RepID=UPI003F988067
MTQTEYRMPSMEAPLEAPARTVFLTTSGDSREPANVASWEVQRELEAVVTRAIESQGWSVRRAFPVDEATGHGFVSSQRMGMDVFAGIPQDAPVVVAIANWQYTHHVLPGLRTHRGPILTVGNFNPTWPGLVGLLGLNASMVKAGVRYASTWTVDGSDAGFQAAVEEWLQTGEVTHDLSHVRELGSLPRSRETDLGQAVAAQLQRDKAIIGVVDEGCMGMYNAIIDDELLNPLGIYKERLSQSELWARMQDVPDEQAQDLLDWLESAGMGFQWGDDEGSELTRQQVLWQMKMYVAACQLTDEFALDAIGIQYQQGLKNLSPASDLVEGMLNSTDRPPVTSAVTGATIRDGVAIPCFNEVDEGVAVDALVSHRLWTAMGLQADTTLHDVRWGEEYDGRFVWVFEISGSLPAGHLDGGWKGALGLRQGPIFFPAGGSTVKGVSKPGEIVWSRVYIEGGRLHVDLGRGEVVDLPGDEVERRSAATNPEWPLANVVLTGVSRDQLMSRHRANHVQLSYAPDAATADRALTAKAACFQRLGLTVHLCGI